MKRLIEWFTINSVAANLLMAGILVGGVLLLVPVVMPLFVTGGAGFSTIPLEVFPEYQLDRIRISAQYRGATPREVERSVVIRIEEAIANLDGIERISSTAREGRGTVTAQVKEGFDPAEIRDKIKNRVDAITSFPEATEEPRISIAQRRWGRDVIHLVVAGQLSERALKELGRRVRDEVVNRPGISQAELSYTRNYEISVEVAQEALRRHGLTLAGVGRAIREYSANLPAGTVETSGGDVLLRTTGRKVTAEQFAKVPVISREDGTRITVGDIGTVKDGFEEPKLISRFRAAGWERALPAVMVTLYRVGDENAINVANRVKEYIQNNKERMAKRGVKLTYWQDRSEIVKGRLGTLLKSALQGGLLVFAVLMLFLRPSIAMWVCVGIPVSFMGAVLLMPSLDVTINIFSLFAFILVLGIVVDDAIVTGESVFTHMRQGKEPLLAAIEGTKAVAIPVTFGVLTTIVAFAVFAFLEGRLGRTFSRLTYVIVPVLIFSLVESKLILPAHLKHVRGKPRRNPFARFQGLFAEALEWFVRRCYAPIVGGVLRYRYVTLTVFVALMILFVGLIVGGKVRYRGFPDVADDEVTARLRMPLGTPFEVTADRARKIEAAAYALQKKLTDPDNGRRLIQNIHTRVGGGQGSHGAEVMMEVLAPEKRSTNAATTGDIKRKWRKRVGAIAGAEEVSFDARIGGWGNPIEIQLAGRSFEKLRKVSAQIQKKLKTFEGVHDITDTFEETKDEIKLSLKPKAALLGLSVRDLGEQVRRAFYGYEAQRIPRDREDVRVMVRYPEAQRKSIETLERMYIRTQRSVQPTPGQPLQTGEVPFSEVAKIKMGEGLPTIDRENRSRVIDVIADVNKEKVSPAAVLEELTPFIEEQVNQQPGMHYTLKGEAEQARKSNRSMLLGLFVVLIGIYALMAIPFRSYVQPFIIMSVIPFGLLGAIAGHMIMGMTISRISVMGMVALIGVVVNDSLVLVDFVNRNCGEGMPLGQAVRKAGAMRFRPVLLTSLTTFAGLSPLMFWEESTQAQFLIPMAVSLGFGVLFATFITLLLVPVNYLVLEDVKSFGLWFIGKRNWPLAEIDREQRSDDRPAA